MSKQHMQKLAATAAVLVLILIVLFSDRGGSKPGTAGGPLIDKVEAYRVLQNEKPTDAAYVSISFTRKSTDYAFANLAIDLNKDGSYATYDLADKSKQEEWVVKNMPVKIMLEGNSFSFDLLDRSVDTGADFKTEVVLSKTPLTDWNGVAPADTSSLSVTISAFQPDDFGKLISPGNPEGSGAAPTEKPVHGGPLNKTNVKVPDAKKYLEDTTSAPAGQGSGDGQAPIAGATPAGGPPAGGTDFSVLQTDVPDMTQGVNECVPTSTSNALAWLGNRYGFSDRLPDQRATMEELKPDFKWSAADGVYVEPNFLSGKTAFVARHNLPIYTHQIGSKFDNNVTEKVAAELAKGQAVEIVIGYYEWNATTNKWERNGGHALSAVGAFGANGQTYLGLHDPASPGANRLDVYKTDKSRMYDYRYRGRYAVFIEYAIAESPTEEWVTAHPPSTAIETSGGIVEARDSQNTWFVDSLKIGTAWYPTAQFHKATGPECDRAEHWHANSGTAIGLDLKDKSDVDYNPSSVQGRNAEIAEWTDPSGCGAGKTAAVEHKNILVSREESERLAARAMAR